MTGGSRSRVVLAYGAMIVGTVLLFLVIQPLGGGLAAPAPSPDAPLFGPAQDAQKVDLLLHVLLALVIVILVDRAVGHLFKLIYQPPVIGEVVAGIVQVVGGGCSRIPGKPKKEPTGA
jgi:hypothetical protein